jgi:hypothetical protein
MADFDNIPQNVVKLRPATNAGVGALVQAKGEFNISALARQHGGGRRYTKAVVAPDYLPAARRCYHSVVNARIMVRRRQKIRARNVAARADTGNGAGWRVNHCAQRKVYRVCMCR